MLQAEFAPAQVFDRPVQGRVSFAEVLRENLDLGRPDHGAGATEVALIFDGRVTRRTPSRCRTRVITDGVIPSPLVDYEHSRIGSRPPDCELQLCSGNVGQGSRSPSLNRPRAPARVPRWRGQPLLRA